MDRLCELEERVPQGDHRESLFHVLERGDGKGKLVDFVGLHHFDCPDYRNSQASGWHTVQTEDLYLKVRSDPDVLADLRAYLDLLDKKIERLEAKRDSEAIPS